MQAFGGAERSGTNNFVKGGYSNYGIFEKVYMFFPSILSSERRLRFRASTVLRRQQRHVLYQGISFV